MDATNARRLRVGDEVIAYFSNARKLATITAIVWPHFTVQATNHAGRVLTEKRRYASLYPPDPPTLAD